MTLHEPIQAPPPPTTTIPVPGAPPPERPRRRWPLIAAGVLLILLVAGGLSLILRGDDGERGDRAGQAGFAGGAIPIGRGSYDMLEYAGSIWVSQGERERVLRVDPATGDVVSFEQDYAYPLRIEAGAGAVWVCMSPAELGRIDTATNELRIVEQGSHGDQPTVFTVGRETVWTGAMGRRTVEILDGEDGHLVDRTKLPGRLADVADSGDGAVFILLQDGTVLIYLETTGDLLGKFSAGAASWGFEYEDEVLFIGLDDGRVVPFDTAGERAGATIDAGKDAGYTEVADGRVWIAYRRDRQLRQFDTSSGRQLGEPLATGRKPEAINIGADGRVWLARADGALVEVRPDGGHTRAPAPLKGAAAEPALSKRITVAGQDEAPTGQDEAPAEQDEAPPTPSPTYSDVSSIAIWWSSSPWDSDTAYAHFKAVDEEGETVAEVRGSDSVDLDEEMGALQETPERRELVDKLRAKLVASGWTEIRVREGGEWYEYEFGR